MHLLLMCLGKSHLFTFKNEVVYLISLSFLLFFFFFKHLLDIKKSIAGQTAFAWEDLKERNSC